MLSVRDVYKKYGDYEALKAITCTFEKGEIVSLLGVNGAGKTTLSSIIAAQHPPTSGDVLFEGNSIYDDIVSYRRFIGYCPQKVSGQFHFKLYDQLWYTGACFGISGSELSDRLLLVAQECGISSVLHRRLGELSGGYRQRFALARSLIHNPHIVILDEPTVALDPHVRRQVWEQVLRIKDQGRTVILTTHYLDEAEFLSDRVCFLEKGRIRLIDTPSAVLHSFGKERLEEVFMSMVEE